MKIYHVSKNLLDITDSNHGMYINDEGEMVYNPAWDTSNYIEVSGITGLTYSLISNNNGIRDLSINEYSSDYTFIGVQSSGTIQRGYNSFSATLNSNTKYVRVSWINAAETSPDTEIMLNSGLTAAEYEPYGNTWVPISVRRYELSKNLFDSETTIEKNGIRAASPTSTYPFGVQYEVTGNNCSPYVAVTPDTTYTITYPAFLGSSRTGLVFYSDTTVESAISGVPTTQQAETYTFTTPANCHYIRFTWKNTNGNNVMLNEGSTALPYQPHGKIWSEVSCKKYGSDHNWHSV